MLTRSEFQKKLAELNEWAQEGCCDSGCPVAEKVNTGSHMCTNGGCCCHPANFAERLLDLATELYENGRYGKFRPE